MGCRVLVGHYANSAGKAPSDAVNLTVIVPPKIKDARIYWFSWSLSIIEWE